MHMQGRVSQGKTTGTVAGPGTRVDFSGRGSTGRKHRKVWGQRAVCRDVKAAHCCGSVDDGWNIQRCDQNGGRKTWTLGEQFRSYHVRSEEQFEG